MIHFAYGDGKYGGGWAEMSKMSSVSPTKSKTTTLNEMIRDSQVRERQTTEIDK
jgi:hypothetical protein